MVVTVAYILYMYMYFDYSNIESNCVYGDIDGTSNQHNMHTIATDMFTCTIHVGHINTTHFQTRWPLLALFMNRG